MKERCSDDITGQRFGPLVALRFSDKTTTGKKVHWYWLFRCDCGREVRKRVDSARGVTMTRCFCRRHDAWAKKNEKVRPPLPRRFYCEADRRAGR